MMAGTSPAEPEFFFVWKSRWPFGNFATADFHQIRSQNVVRCHVAESWKTLSKIFTLGVICPQNLKSKIGQTGTSLRAGYRMHCREILFTPRCSPRTSEFPRSCQLFSLTYTVAELRASNLLNFRILAYFPYTKPLKRIVRWPDCSPGVTSQNNSYFPCGSWRPRGVPSGTGGFLRLLVGELGTPKRAQIFAYGKCLYP